MMPISPLVNLQCIYRRTDYYMSFSDRPFFLPLWQVYLGLKVWRSFLAVNTLANSESLATTRTLNMWLYWAINTWIWPLWPHSTSKKTMLNLMLSIAIPRSVPCLLISNELRVIWLRPFSETFFFTFGTSNFDIKITQRSSDIQWQHLLPRYLWNNARKCEYVETIFIRYVVVIKRNIYT